VGFYEVIEHTADAGIVARGPTLEAVFEATAEGMYSLMVDPETVEVRLHKPVSATGSDVEHRLMNWLLELLLVTEVEGLVFRRFTVEFAEEQVNGTAFGEPLDEARHEVRGMVKGVTRHQLSVGREPDGFVARVIFDL
jgi:SHS2 domain-containing protein